MTAFIALLRNRILFNRFNAALMGAMASGREIGGPGVRWSSSVFFPSWGPAGFNGNRIPATFRCFDKAATSPRTRYGAAFRIFSD
jgi:hypothetical protein